jgi:hypothetical protein
VSAEESRGSGGLEGSGEEEEGWREDSDEEMDWEAAYVSSS